jgi:hypothetical protein
MSLLRLIAACVSALIRSSFFERQPIRDAVPGQLRIIFDNTLLGMDSSIIFLQLSKFLASSFFGSFTRAPFNGMESPLSSVSSSVGSALISFAQMLSKLGAFLDFRGLIV